MDFLSLQHISAPEIHISDRLPHLSSFRLQGLTTLMTASSLWSLVNTYVPTALVGFTLRSTARQKGIVMFPPQCTHMPFLSHVMHRPSSAHGDVSRGFWVSTLSASSGEIPALKLKSPSDSLGFCLSRVSRILTLSLPSKALLSCASQRSHNVLSHPALQSLDRLVPGGIGISFRRSLRRNPPKVLAPVHSSALRRKHTGLCVHLISKPTFLSCLTESLV
jgi:hypothetical protein